MKSNLQMLSPCGFHIRVLRETNGKPILTWLVTLASLLLAPAAHAQFSADYQTNTITTAASWTGDYVVGSNTSFDVLFVLNGGVLTNAAGYLGYTATANNNLAVVNGTGGVAVWRNSTNLVVGNSGDGNTLVITNGGQVSSVGTSAIGYNSGANGNLVTVTGNGSVWTNTGILYVGYLGALNRLVITNGGTAVSSGGVGIINVTAIGDSGGSNSNIVTVTGSGSLWTNDGTLMIGRASSFNQLVITNGGTVINGASVIGRLADNNLVTVTGNSSTWTNTGTIVVGVAASFNELVITNGGKVVSMGDNTLGNNAGANSNRVTVSGSGSLWTNNGAIRVGHSGSFNQLVIANGGGVASTTLNVIGNNAGANSNLVTVTGSDSYWSNSYLTVGNNGYFNQLIVSNGARVISAGAGAASSIIGSAAAATNSLVLVTGNNSFWSNGGTTFYLGLSGIGSQLVISNGGSVVTPSTTIADAAGSVSNTLTVTGSGSTWTNNSVTIGRFGSFNEVVISNGATAVGTTVTLGNFAGANDNVATVTAGGTWTNTGAITVGNAGLSNALLISNGGRVFATGVTSGSTAGSNRVEITTGGLLDANSLVAGSLGGNSISNVGGIYQFSSVAPTITPNGAGRIALTDGTISFRGVTNANVLGNQVGSQLTSIDFAGNNAFRLNNSSNTATVAQNYTFATNLGSANYASLELVNDGTLWRSARTTIDAGGKLLASNTVGRIESVITNLGTIEVVQSTVTWASNVVISGNYTSDPSTNLFEQNLTLTQSGYLQGSTGDLFRLQRNWVMQSTNRTLFNLVAATVLFTNGIGMHFLDLTGSGALDNGSNFVGVGSITDNFALGSLALSAGDTLHLTGGVVNALYVGVLDLGGFNLANTNNLILDVNLYYDSNLVANAYLGGFVYDLAGAGALIPYPGPAGEVIPEPSTLGFLLLGGLALLGRRRSR